MLNEDEIRELWDLFIMQYGYNLKISMLSEKYPEERSLYIDFMEIQDFSQELLENLTTNPEETLLIGEEVIAKKFPEEQKVEIVHIRLKNIPDDRLREIRKIRSKNIGELITIEGLVRQVTEVRPKLLTGAFECASCGHINYKDQETENLEMPLYCEGCGKKKGETKFKLLEDFSVFLDSQKIEVQENPEDIRGGEQPQRLQVYLEDDLTGIVVPGDRVRITGILKTRPRGTKQFPSVVFDIYLHAINVESIKEEYKSINLTEEDVERIREFAQDKNVIEKLRKKIASTLFGLDIEKEAILLQLFGGVPLKRRDGTRIRGDIHILLVGDPGTGKSQLLKYITNIAPKSIYTSGKGSTAAGLTAAATKEEFGEGRWTLEAGALVLADNGIAAIDEIDKMDDKDRVAMHEAMEQQTITISKAGMNATLMARCSILAAANPKFGRFDVARPLSDQLNLPPTLLSRFDAIFKMPDIPGEIDSQIADHILDVHMERESEKEEIDDEFFKKYIAYAKKHIIPRIMPDAREELKQYYLKMRNLYNQTPTKSIPITARQMEALIRLTQASARARLSNIATAEDAKRAIKIIQHFIEDIATTPEGTIDIDRVVSTIPSGERSKYETIMDIIKDLSTGKGYAGEDEIIREAKVRSGIDEHEVRKILNVLARDNLVYQPFTGRYKAIE
ncbi:MAG: minichromosome maintenance protein MCM [Thermoplasmata archaeon]|jgi:replicative DNA helicase Mcm|nr:minichromosome maintenance protein MCM [Thermoplasmata archaeon]MVT12907.1 AAA domain-containing protein [Euryarchaeota archaeon]MVT14443.1 AAA domain-containing protein [Euryarchaeota archaeon]MVT36192.1 AAA domain-containing protein [Euryarchaeota archaeon]